MELEFEIDKITESIEADEIDFVVVNRKWTKKDRAEMSQGLAEYYALRNSLTAQGYSEEEIRARLNARFANKNGKTKRPRLTKTATATTAQRRNRRDNAVLTA